MKLKVPVYFKKREMVKITTYLPKDDIEWVTELGNGYQTGIRMVLATCKQSFLEHLAKEKEKKKSVGVAKRKTGQCPSLERAFHHPLGEKRSNNI